MRLPPRMASLSASLRNDAFKTRSTVTGQMYGRSVPYTIWLVPISATRCRRPSSENTIVSASTCCRRYSLGGASEGTCVGPQARYLGPPEVRRQVPAAVGPAHPQAWELVEGAVEDQAREEDGGFERVTDDVAHAEAAGTGFE